MVACDACGFVFNRAFDPALPCYGAGYDNAQRHSPAFATHLEALARHLVEERGVRGARIVEIGCGQGDFRVADGTCAEWQFDERKKQ